VATEPVPTPEIPAVADTGPTATEPTSPPATEDVLGSPAGGRGLRRPAQARTDPAGRNHPGSGKDRGARGQAGPGQAVDLANPVKVVWALAEEMKAADPNVTRKAIVDACIAKGVAFCTAKTQVQRFLKAKKNPKSD
jgi:hypothetical protein